MNTAHVNTVRHENVIEGGCRREATAQGLFVVAEIFCGRCGSEVGYRVVQDESEHGRNRHQVGRFGLVIGRIKLHVNKATI